MRVVMSDIPAESRYVIRLVLFPCRRRHHSGLFYFLAGELLFEPDWSYICLMQST
jgi:hypothetical protein